MCAAGFECKYPMNIFMGRPLLECTSAAISPCAHTKIPCMYVSLIIGIYLVSFEAMLVKRRQKRPALHCNGAANGIGTLRELSNQPVERHHVVRIRKGKSRAPPLSMKSTPAAHHAYITHVITEVDGKRGNRVTGDDL
jgi:hypothetical protein